MAADWFSEESFAGALASRGMDGAPGGYLAELAAEAARIAADGDMSDRFREAYDAEVYRIAAIASENLRDGMLSRALEASPCPWKHRVRGRELVAWLTDELPERSRAELRLEVVGRDDYKGPWSLLYDSGMRMEAAGRTIAVLNGPYTRDVAEIWEWAAVVLAHVLAGRYDERLEEAGLSPIGR